MSFKTNKQHLQDISEQTNGTHLSAFLTLCIQIVQLGVLIGILLKLS